MNASSREPLIWAGEQNDTRLDVFRLAVHALGVHGPPDRPANTLRGLEQDVGGASSGFSTRGDGIFMPSYQCRHATVADRQSFSAEQIAITRSPGLLVRRALAEGRDVVAGRQWCGCPRSRPCRPAHNPQHRSFLSLALFWRQTRVITSTNSSAGASNPLKRCQAGVRTVGEFAVAPG